MENDYLFPNEDNISIKHTPIRKTRPKESIAKNLGFYNFNPKPRASTASVDFSHSLARGKKDFIPFINERDSLNRLITASPENSTRKTDPPSNPIFYYKSIRFTKSTLRAEHGKKSKNGLDKLLVYNPENPEKTQASSPEKRPKTSQPMVYTYNNKGLRMKDVEMGPKGKEISPLRLGRLETEEKEYGLTNSSSLQNLRDRLKSHKRIASHDGVSDKYHKPPEGFSGSRKKPKERNFKHIFLPTDTFADFFVKLDADSQKISVSSARFQRKTEGDIDQLNCIVKNYEDKKLTTIQNINEPAKPKIMGSTLTQQKWMERSSYPKSGTSSQNNIFQTRRVYTESSQNQNEMRKSFMRRSQKINSFSLKGLKIH